jgi:hypothetical protein
MTMVAMEFAAARLRLGWTGLALAAAALTQAAATQAQLPFSPGEELTYRLRVGGLGTVGTGTMRVEGPVYLRGTSTLLLRSEMRSTLATVNGIGRTSSWLDPIGMRALRFEKHERTPFARLDEAIDLFGPRREWRTADGTVGRSPTNAPLDELSFIYFVRTLPLAPGAVFTFDRHFDPRRNPISIRVVRREPISVGAGRFQAFVVEMRVRDPQRYRGTGLITLHISDCPSRLPLRIESSVPTMGTTVLTLERHVAARIAAAGR